MSTDSYRALAIRYRPSKLNEVVGQDPVIKVLKNSIKGNRIHHAFLFTGTRGIGKTTLARILAISLNCSNQESSTVDPCLKCNNCLQIINGSHPDVVEFDAASKTGVDSMREIIENCMYAPMSARYKVYIIDEVHMLSKGAFNALLKTVEEPMENLKFIFATTELHKVPITISSRCQKFILKNIPTLLIQKNLEDIAKKEGYEIEEDATNLIARYSDGSIRDSLSLLDQVLSNAEKQNKITLSEIRSVLSVPDNSAILELLNLIFKKDVLKVSEKASDLMREIDDINYVLTTLLLFLTNIIKYSENIPIEDSSLKTVYDKHKKNLSRSSLMSSWQILNDSIKNIPAIPAEDALSMICIKVIYISSISPSDILDKIEKLKEDS